MNSSALTMIESQEYWQNYPIPAEFLPSGIIPVNLAVGTGNVVWLNLLKEHRYQFRRGAFHHGWLMYGLLRLQDGVWQRFTFAELGLPELEHSFKEFSCDFRGASGFFFQTRPSPTLMARQSSHFRLVRTDCHRT